MLNGRFGLQNYGIDGSGNCFFNNEGFLEFEEEKSFFFFYM